jgi:hypothetical protein
VHLDREETEKIAEVILIFTMYIELSNCVHELLQLWNSCKSWRGRRRGSAVKRSLVHSPSRAKKIKTFLLPSFKITSGKVDNVLNLYILA